MDSDIGQVPHGIRLEPPGAGSRVKQALWWVVPLLALAALAIGYLLWPQPAVEQPPAAAPPRVEAPPAAQAEPAVRHPIEDARPETKEPVAATPLPSLNESDRAIADALAGLVGSSALDQFLASSGLVRRVVATVDNLPRPKAPVRMWPVKPTPGSFGTAGAGEAVRIDPANYRRYEPFVRFAESVDTGQAVALYVRFYPLFQQAYKELGYPDRHFNDRAVEVIDHLLAAPEVAGPVALGKPWVMWEYADPALEARSAGQKALIRMGPDNARRLKAKLREIRRQVTRSAPAQ
jgi:hypothetical protein